MKTIQEEKSKLSLANKTELNNINDSKSLIFETRKNKKTKTYRIL